ncbi:hypothetical protein V6N11_065369 [Hibiscus sabdariffa]|uniref:Uncharacterized protein n=2 Tax=Hibiscus sabdariffa TaxID=183260 RepID=A0ABR2AIT4_9ROSI
MAIDIVSSLHAELWSILVGLQLAWSIGVTRIQVQSDSFVAIRLVLDPMAMTSSLPLVRAIALFSNHDWSIDFIWVPQTVRVTNISSDVLGGSALVGSIKRLIGQDWRVVVKHIVRDNNRVVDILAKRDRNLHMDSMIFTTPPMDTVRLVEGNRGFLRRPLECLLWWS